MFKLPEDIEIQLQKQYPGVHIQSLIHKIFQAILEKTLYEGSCTIREMGKFISFTTYSAKLGKNVVRFKFRISPALDNKIKSDEYLIEQVPVKAKVEFSKKHQERCDREIKMLNTKAMQEASKRGQEETKKKLAREIIHDIIFSDDSSK